MERVAPGVGAARAQARLRPLAYSLDVKNTFTMNVEFYTGIDERLEMPMILPPVPDLVDLAESRGLALESNACESGGLALGPHVSR